MTAIAPASMTGPIKAHPVPSVKTHPARCSARRRRSCPASRSRMCFEPSAPDSPPAASSQHQTPLPAWCPGVEALLQRYAFSTRGEITLLIVQALVGPPGATLPGIRRVFSHPVALAQCRRFFRSHPEMTAVPAFDTAGAVAEIVLRGCEAHAAIASVGAARQWGAVVLQENIQDRPDDFTRFVRISGRRHYFTF